MNGLRSLSLTNIRNIEQNNNSSRSHTPHSTRSSGNTTPVSSFRERVYQRKKEVYLPIFKTVFNDLKEMINTRFETYGNPDELNVPDDFHVSVFQRYDYPEDLHKEFSLWSQLSTNMLTNELSVKLTKYFGSETYVTLQTMDNMSAGIFKAVVYPLREVAIKKSKKWKILKSFFISKKKYKK